MRSIYAAAVEAEQRKRDAQRFQEWAFGQFIKFAFPLVIKWERRKPPENRAVQRSLELRG